MKTLLTTLHSKFIHNSLALPCLAAYCGDVAGEIVIREFTVHEPKEAVLSAILSESPDVVAFSVYLWNRRETFELIDLLGVAEPDLKIVVGGPEVSFEGPDLFASHPGLTALIRGEGEKPLRGLLRAWANGSQPAGVCRLTWRAANGGINVEADAPALPTLDDIPSPFELGLVDVSRGFVYYESSRGCPYRCSFCMSALDDAVRSYSMERIESDLTWLLDRRVPKIKLVDRTFNYDPQRALRIFRFILERNEASHFHFEIGGHLIDAPTLDLLEAVPEGMFHFEIGVQSTLPATHAAIDRKVSLDKVVENIVELRRRTRVELHLDLIAGLPGEDYERFLKSVEAVLALNPDHLQIEPVKVLPGSPLRRSAKAQNLRYDPNPPYTIVSGGSLNYADLETLKAISRVLDLTWNSNRLRGFLAALSRHHGSMSGSLEILALHLQKRGLFRMPISQEGLLSALWEFVRDGYSGHDRALLQEHLARDHALCERVILSRVPDYFDTALTQDEQAQVRERVRQYQKDVHGRKTRLQYFAAVFREIDGGGKRRVHLFLYFTRSNRGLEIEEFVFAGAAEAS